MTLPPEEIDRLGQEFVESLSADWKPDDEDAKEMSASNRENADPVADLILDRSISANAAFYDSLHAELLGRLKKNETPEQA